MKSLGVRPLINAYATMTKFGGSLMPPEVVAAMNEAAKAFVDLQQSCSARVGERIAEADRQRSRLRHLGRRRRHCAGIGRRRALQERPDALKRFPEARRLPQTKRSSSARQRNPYDYSHPADRFEIHRN